MGGPPPEGSFEFVAHTADIAVRLRAPSVEALFAVAAGAFTAAVTDRRTVAPRQERVVERSAPELDLLLVDWLEELLYLFETEGFLVRDAKVEIAHGDTKVTKDEKSAKYGESSSGVENPDLRDLRDEYVVRGTLRGEPRDPARHQLKLLVKAVTYHGLHIADTADGCEATVIFDI